MPQSPEGDKLASRTSHLGDVPYGGSASPSRRGDLIALACAALLAGGFVQAREAAGVRLEEQTRIKGVAAPLVLNGAGTRSKFFVKIYVAGLYLEKKMSSAEAILTSPGPKRVRMHFVYGEISAEEIRAAWTTGYEANHSVGALAALEDRIGEFNGYFPTLKAGDVVNVDYVPGAGTTVRINGEAGGTIPGEDSHRATLRIWFGASPASSSLKEAMIAGGS